MTSFPTMVYKSPGPHNAGRGRTYDFKGIKNEDQLNDALKKGWYLTMAEALKDDKPEVLAKAEKLGIDVDKRMKADTIKKLVNEKEEELKEEAKANAFKPAWLQ